MYKVFGALAAIIITTLTSLSLAVHHRPTPSPTPTPSPILRTACHINGQLPDPICTPGSINPNVTQANINQTICVKGWTSTIRPPQTYTAPLKRQSIIDYGYADTNPAHYEEDHLISLELGGNPTDVKNLWAQPGASPNAKDAVEGRLRAEVCSGKITLSQAQHEIATNWMTAQ